MIRTIDNLSHQSKLKMFFFSLARRLRGYMILVSTLAHRIYLLGVKTKKWKELFRMKDSMATY